MGIWTRGLFQQQLRAAAVVHPAWPGPRPGSTPSWTTDVTPRLRPRPPAGTSAARTQWTTTAGARRRRGRVHGRSAWLSVLGPVPSGDAPRRPDPAARQPARSADGTGPVTAPHPSARTRGRGARGGLGCSGPGPAAGSTRRGGGRTTVYRRPAPIPPLLDTCPSRERTGTPTSL